MLVIDKKTGTILDLDDCYVVEPDHLTEDSYSDSEIGEIAEKHGRSLAQICKFTGYGDNRYSWSVSYSPKSIKDEADAWLEGGIYTETDKEYDALKWALSASEEELADVSNHIVTYDSVWDGFRDNLLEGLLWVYGERNK